MLKNLIIHLDVGEVTKDHHKTFWEIIAKQRSILSKGTRDLSLTKSGKIIWNCVFLFVYAVEDNISRHLGQLNVMASLKMKI